MKPLGPTDLKRLHREWRRRTPPQRVAVLLDGVEGPFNVGGILRTAAALRVETVWLAGRTPGPENPKVRRTELGTARYLDLRPVEDVAEAVAQVRASGYRLVGVELTGAAQPLFSLDLTGDVCIAVGHEDRGLSAACLEACDAVGYVPLLGRVGSLNVTTAAGMALYEVRRQVWTGATASGPGPDVPDDTFT